MNAPYTMQAINLYDSIHIKGLKNLLSGKVVFASPNELQFQHTENSYVMVYRFGCLVFAGLTPDETERELTKIKAALGQGVPNPTTETYQVMIADVAPKVEFEHVEIKKISPEIMRLISMSVAQSASLEYFELTTDKMLFETARFTEDLARLGTVPLKSRRLMKIIGSTASTRQHIISNLSILDPPDETWKSKELEKLHRDLQANFDIDLRFKTLDRKLTLMQDNIEILSELVSTRKATLLETMILLLIAFEIVLKFLA